MKHVLIALSIALAVSACGKKEPEVKSADQQRAERLAASDKNKKLQELLEQQRSTALNNIQFNVATYFSLNPRFQPATDWNVIPHTDDYIDSACPQGSGWGWANIMNTKLKDEKGGPTKYKVFCSTSSASLGCYIENDFKTSPHGKNANKCNEDLPHPLKPLR